MKHPPSTSIESLEPRVLFAYAAIANGTLMAIGDLQRNNTIEMSYSEDTKTIHISLNDREYDFDITKIARILLRTGHQHDRITIDESDGVIGLPIRVNGFGGNDFIRADISHTLMYGGPGHDTIYGGSGNDTLYGEGSSDDIYGDGGKDYIRGGSGNDLLDGEDGDDRLYGDDGHDDIYGGRGGDFLHGGNGDDYLVDATEYNTYNVFRGANGFDVFYIGYDDVIQDDAWYEYVYVEGDWDPW